MSSRKKRITYVVPLACENVCPLIFGTGAKTMTTTVATVGEGRRRWTVADKARIAEESLMRGTPRSIGSECGGPDRTRTSNQWGATINQDETAASIRMRLCRGRGVCSRGPRKRDCCAIHRIILAISAGGRPLRISRQLDARPLDLAHRENEISALSRI